MTGYHLQSLKYQDIKDMWRAEKSTFRIAGASWMVVRFTVMAAETFNSGQRERGGGTAASQIPQTKA